MSVLSTPRGLHSSTFRLDTAVTIFCGFGGCGPWARCTGSQRTLAVKVLNGAMGHTPAARRDLESEVNVLTKVRHTAHRSSHAPAQPHAAHCTPLSAPLTAHRTPLNGHRSPHAAHRTPHAAHRFRRFPHSLSPSLRPTPLTASDASHTRRSHLPVHRVPPLTSDARDAPPRRAAPSLPYRAPPRRPAAEPPVPDVPGGRGHHTRHGPPLRGHRAAGGRQGLTLVHIFAQPEPFWSLKQAKHPTTWDNKCSR